jgi:hypothetical protein
MSSWRVAKGEAARTQANRRKAGVCIFPEFWRRTRKNGKVFMSRSLGFAGRRHSPHLSLARFQSFGCFFNRRRKARFVSSRSRKKCPGGTKKFASRLKQINWRLFYEGSKVQRFGVSSLHFFH